MTEAQASTLRAYDAIAPVYAEYSSRYARYLDAIDTLVTGRLKPGSRLLDVGSGDGRRLAKIAAAARLAEVHAVEPSPEMAARCEERTGFPVHRLFAGQLDQVTATGFDAVTVLWNVFGHMPDGAARLEALRQIRAKLAADGQVLLDVNNRHNAASYGRWKVRWRRVLDALAFDERRGDVRYDWKIGDQSIPSSGHLFTPAEMAALFRGAGLRIAERLAVDYRTGDASASPFDGQLFYRLVPA